jgi:hypothetical protein
MSEAIPPAKIIPRANMHGMYIVVEGFAHLGRLYAPQRQIAHRKSAKRGSPKLQTTRLGTRTYLIQAAHAME